MDNRWVVPYNPYLSLKYGSHINVELCSSVASVKYIYKYIYKGFDCASVEINHQSNNKSKDEVKTYLNARYVTSHEAAWKLFNFKMFHKSHTVYRLPVHLSNQQPVFFQTGNEEEALARAANNHTKLTAWFELNKHDSSARKFLYHEIPYHFTYDQKMKSWIRRKNSHKTVSRMYAVSPKEGERYFLRLLLLHQRGARSFQELKTVDNISYKSYREACLALNLLDNDDEWDRCLTEASNFKMAKQLRDLFATICVFCNPSNPLKLWEKFKEFMSEDYKHKNMNDPESRALQEINEFLKVHSMCLGDFGLPIPKFHEQLALFEFDNSYEAAEGAAKFEQLNGDQRIIVERILKTIEKSADIKKCFFMDGPGGSGKTFTYNTLMHILRGRGEIVLCVAWTGIAATLLSGGKTAHSQFGLPLNLNETAVSSLKENDKRTEILRRAKFIIWDEASMVPKFALEVVDRLFRQIMKLDLPFGGKCILLGGDFRPILPVVPHGSKTLIIENNIQRSFLWSFFDILRLMRNMRADPNEQAFSEWLISVGNGSVNDNDDFIRLPDQCITTGSIIDYVYPLKEPLDNVDLVKLKCILCPTNDDTFELNDQVLDRLEGPQSVYYSYDNIECDDEEERTNFSPEFLNGLTLSGMPLHKLRLKKHSIVVLLRNLNVKHGICNGTRLKVVQLMKNVIDVEVITGARAGLRLFLPRIVLSSADPLLPFKLIRKQFPIRLAYCMTISKSQGQTFRSIGIYLREPVFTHGQLYVALSRVSSLNNVKIKIVQSDKHGKKGALGYITKNIVYKDILIN